eukprot:TRINITY_DN11649_c0_g1_i1.p1 TRINITY_DN11649_c0_g1~~TRINITY_DN11649_c0_g1_i1.p1  ORF type:complete len:552 (-),score=141.26 TRINITY_DN11649_c0_g1_i1:71-1525(-)
MVSVMKCTGVTHVCFGNHEADISDEALTQRIVEFVKPGKWGHSGVWINSNMPQFTSPEHLPTFATEEITSKDHSHKRRVALLGLLCHDQNLYLPTAFGGAVRSLTPVNETAIAMKEKLCADHDLVLPLTHQEIAHDRELAKTGVFGLILGGHDHQEYFESIEGSILVKSGIDAHKATIADVYWKDRDSKPEFFVKIVDVKENREPDPQVEKEIQKHLSKIKALEIAVLYSHKGPEMLSSKDIRLHQTTMGTVVCNACKAELEVDAVLIDAGAIRANKDYEDRHFRLADIKKEIPFDTDMARVVLPGKVLSEVLKFSRRSQDVSENGGFLQADEGVQVDPATGEVTHIAGGPVLPEQLYSVGMLLTSINGMNNNVPLQEWFETHPRPPPDSGRPAKPLLINYFCKVIWKHLPAFEAMDKSGDGFLSQEEVLEAYTKAFNQDINRDGVVDDVENEATRIVVQHLIEALNLDEDKRISREEYYSVLF